MKIAFIVNPKAGVKKNKDILTLIKENVPEGVVYEILLWEKLDLYDDLIKRVFDEGFTTCVAVGGDGTVNRIASSLVHTNVALGIVPTGSGNGLARHLKIPLKTTEAIKRVCTATPIIIDGAMINGNHFFCTSGAGFDAYVGYLFAGSKTRGISTYLKIILKNLFSYKAQEYTLVSDENTATHKAFLVTIANANQYGNDTFIAPHADIQDGHLDVCFIKPFPLWQIPFLGIKIMNGTVGKSKYYHTYKTKKIEVHRNAKAAVHYDGEPALMDELLTVEVLPAALKVIAGVGF